MTEGAKKQYVNLWVKKDKNGNPFLGGKHKATDTRYFVFTQEGEQVLKKSVAGGEFVTVGTMQKRESDDGASYLSLNGMSVSENRFFDAADPYMTYSEQNGGGYVLDSNGEKVPAPEYTISIPAEVQDADIPF